MGGQKAFPLPFPGGPPQILLMSFSPKGNLLFFSPLPGQRFFPRDCGPFWAKRAQRAFLKMFLHFLNPKKYPQHLWQKPGREGPFLSCFPSENALPPRLLKLAAPFFFLTARPAIPRFWIPCGKVPPPPYPPTFFSFVSRRPGLFFRTRGGSLLENPPPLPLPSRPLTDGSFDFLALWW